MEFPLINLHRRPFHQIGCFDWNESNNLPCGSWAWGEEQTHTQIVCSYFHHKTPHSKGYTEIHRVAPGLTWPAPFNLSLSVSGTFFCVSSQFARASWLYDWLASIRSKISLWLCMIWYNFRRCARFHPSLLVFLPFLSPDLSGIGHLPGPFLWPVCFSIVNGRNTWTLTR